MSYNTPRPTNKMFGLSNVETALAAFHIMGPQSSAFIKKLMYKQRFSSMKGMHRGWYCFYFWPGPFANASSPVGKLWDPKKHVGVRRVVTYTRNWALTDEGKERAIALVEELSRNGKLGEFTNFIQDFKKKFDARDPELVVK